MPRDDGHKPLSEFLRQVDGPAIVVDRSRARIEASNASARALLGLVDGADDQPVALDRSTPALVQLAQLIDAPGRRATAAPQWRPLTFWIAARAVTVPAKAVSGLQGNDHLVLVRFQPEQAPEAVAPLPSPDLRSGHARAPRDSDWTREGRDADSAGQSGEPVSRDAATLKEIARRIREGASETRQPAPRPESGSLSGATPSSMIAPVPSSRERENPSDAAGPVPPDKLARVAHELRTPLSAIAAFAEIMRDEKFGPLENARYRGYVRDILESSRHALDVVSSLGEPQDTSVKPGNLAFSKLDLNEICAAMASTIAPLAEEAGLQVKTALAPQLPHVVADGRSLRQILLNLLTNALKFTGTGGTVTVRTARAGAGAVIVEVEDTGIGINPEAIDRALAGHRLSTGTAAEVGLGLPLVKTLAEANGAAVEVASAPGKGTRVALIFPPGRLVHTTAAS